MRAVLYWLIGSAANWSAKLNLDIIELSFRSTHPGQMFFFSILSFVQTIWIFYLWLLLLSILNGPLPFHNFVRTQLGGMDRWPRGVKLLLPFVATTLLWWLASWPLAWMHIIPQPVSAMHRLGESSVFGLTSYLAWELIAIALLVLHLLNSYIYFGKQPFWVYVNAEAQTLLSPLRRIPLRVGKVDFAPVAGMVVVFLLAQGAEWLLIHHGRAVFDLGV